MTLVFFAFKSITLSYSFVELRIEEPAEDLFVTQFYIFFAAIQLRLDDDQVAAFDLDTVFNQSFS